MKKRIRDSFARQSMMTTFGARVDEISEGRVVLSAPILETALQQQGAAHAALSFALGDSAAGYAALTLIPADQDVMTAEMKINLLAPARGERLRAVGRVVKPGRRLIIVSADVYALEGAKETHVALLQGTMVPVAI
ncbi:MAG: PaaI family thioesterase [Paracoccaceae bacterium]